MSTANRTVDKSNCPCTAGHPAHPTRQSPQPDRWIQAELRLVLTQHWRTFGVDLDIDDFIDAQAIAAVARLTGGNFRLIQRLFTQTARVLTINELGVITADVVEAASSTPPPPVLGAT